MRCNASGGWEPATWNPTECASHRVTQVASVDFTEMTALGLSGFSRLNGQLARLNAVAREFWNLGDLDITNIQSWLAKTVRFLASVETLGVIDSAARRNFFITNMCCTISNVLRRLGRMTMGSSAGSTGGTGTGNGTADTVRTVDSANGGYRARGTVVFTSATDIPLGDIEAEVLGILEEQTAASVAVPMTWRVSAYRAPSSECMVRNARADEFEALVPAGSIGYYMLIRGQSHAVAGAALAGLLTELSSDGTVENLLDARFPSNGVAVTRAIFGCADAQGRPASSCVFRTGPISESFEHALSRLTTLLVPAGGRFSVRTPRLRMDATTVACPVPVFRSFGGTDGDTGDRPEMVGEFVDVPVSFSLSVADAAFVAGGTVEGIDGARIAPGDRAECRLLSGPAASAVAQLGYSDDSLTEADPVPWRETVLVPGPAIVAARCSVNSSALPAAPPFSIVFTAYDSVVFFVPDSADASAAASADASTDGGVAFIDPEGSNASSTFSARISSRIAAVTLGAYEAWETYGIPDIILTHHSDSSFGTISSFGPFLARFVGKALYPPCAPSCSGSAAVRQLNRCCGPSLVHLLAGSPARAADFFKYFFGCSVGWLALAIRWHAQLFSHLQGRAARRRPGALLRHAAGCGIVGAPGPRVRVLLVRRPGVAAGRRPDRGVVAGQCERGLRLQPHHQLCGADRRRRPRRQWRR